MLTNLKSQYPQYKDRPDDEILGAIKKKYPAYRSIDDETLSLALEYNYTAKPASTKVDIESPKKHAEAEKRYIEVSNKLLDRKVRYSNVRSNWADRMADKHFPRHIDKNTGEDMGVRLTTKKQREQFSRLQDTYRAQFDQSALAKIYKEEQTKLRKQKTDLQDGLGLSSPVKRAVEKYGPGVEAAIAFGFLTVGSLQAIKSAKDLYGVMRLTEKVVKLKPVQRKALFQIAKTQNFNTKSWPSWFRDGFTSSEQANLLRGKTVKTFVTKPNYLKFENAVQAFRQKAGIRGEGGFVAPQLREVFSGPGLTKKGKEDIEKLPKVPVGALPVVFSPKTYDRIEPNIRKEWAVFNSAGKSFKQFSDQVVKSHGPQAKQYLDKFREEDPVNKLVTALKGAKSVRGKQEALYSEERGKRIAAARKVGEKVSGEKGFFAELGKLRGELPKAQFEAIRKSIDQKDIDKLFDVIKNNPVLSEWDKVTARKGLAKMLGEGGGSVPTEGELKLLNSVYGREFTSEILKHRGFINKLKESAYQLANIPRSLMASFDMSAPFRQGVFFVGKKQFWNALRPMVRAFGDEKAYKALQDDVVKRPTFQLMKDSKLALTEMGDIISQREEAFMSNWAEKIPLAGRVVRASGRAHLGFLNKLRADVFDDLVKKASSVGLNPQKNPDLTKAIAGFINNATGRGSLGGLERSAITLNSFFFSPRLMASRLKLLNPVYYVTQPPFVRKQALKSLFSFAAIASSVLALAKLGGAEVETDPRSADFAKIKIGNTRVDVLGGFQQYIRLAAQLITGKIKSSKTGRIIKLGEGYKPLTRLGILSQSLEYKTSPVSSFGIGLMRGRTSFGEEFDIPKETANRFTPMVIQDVYDIAQDDPSLLPISALGFVGVGLQTYGKKKPKAKPTPGGVKTIELKELKTTTLKELK